MNYRHIYHAGSFADVLKHAILARIVTYLQGKDKAFRVIDTHAGIGLYDLSSPEAQKTGEWKGGIGRILEGPLPGDAADLLAPYLDIVRGLNEPGRISRYPGSPMVARALFRRQDRLSAIELHPQDAGTLQALFAGDHQVRVIPLDGWLALGAHVPPKEKRGLVLVDPPFEAPGEFDRMVDGLARALRRWRGGTYCLWYPIKHGDGRDAFHSRLGALGLDHALCLELWVRNPDAAPGLSGSGMIVVNPPFTLEREARMLLPALSRLLGVDDDAGSRVFGIGKDATVSENGDGRAADRRPPA